MVGCTLILAMARQRLGCLMRAIILATVATLAMGALDLAASAANASDVVSVTWRKAQIMSFGGGISSIVIGDPSVIDVTLEGSGQIVVFGKLPGETNMLVLGADNSVLFDAAVVVMPEDERHVSIISPGSNIITERSWNCLTRCVQVLGPGGTAYVSVTPGASGTYGKLGEAIDNAKEQQAQDAAGQTAQGIGEANSGVARGAAGVGGQAGTMVPPY